MNKKRLYILISLMSFALAGIIFVQILWINNAYELKQAQFKRSVHEVLVDVSEKIQNREALFFVWNDISKKSTDTITFSGKSNMGIKVVQYDSNKLIEIHKTISKDSFINDKQIFINNESVDSIIIISDSVIKKNIRLKTVIDSNYQRIEQVVSKVAIEISTEDMPISERLEITKLDSVLNAKIKNNDISDNYKYAVVNSKTDSVVFGDSSLNKFAADSNLYKVELFPGNLVSEPYILKVYFPGHKKQIYKSISLMLWASMFFTIFIMLIFAITINIILRQKKISDIKSDFINNMTHEFKTPIATISLSADSITNPKVINNPEKIEYFTHKIKQENKRMNNLIENVLQMALVEKDSFKLNTVKSDVNSIIQDAINGVEIQIEKRNGQIRTNFCCEELFAQLDILHFTNVIYNLLDNANKYSETTPDITIETKIVAEKILISVTDKGIGMSKEERNKIFEKFYRATKGDIHNIKGFGLGLSYVKTIVEAHNGLIYVQSAKGEGSNFTIELPLNN